MATITLANIQSYAQIPDNIEGRLIDFQINLASTFDVEPIVTKALMSAVDVAVASPGTKPEIEAFYNNFIVPYWCLSSYYRFIATHGTNVTQFGLVQTRDPRGTFEQSSDQSRANVLTQTEADRKVFKQYLVDRLKELNFTFDGVTYGESTTINRKTNYINSIRKKEVRPFGNSYNRNLNR